MRGFILGVFLLALVGWCMVHETMKQTHARYELAESARREAEMAKRLEKLLAYEESLKQPARLAAMARELKLDVVNLVAIGPDAKALPAGYGVSRRKPGETYEPEAGEGGDASLAALDGRRGR